MNDYDNGEPITIWPPTTIQQTARERLSELIRAGGIAWKEANDPDWRGKPWMDGVLVDVDESDVVDAIVDRIITGSDPDAPASSGGGGMSALEALAACQEQRADLLELIQTEREEVAALRAAILTEVDDAYRVGANYVYCSRLRAIVAASR